MMKKQRHWAKTGVHNLTAACGLR